MTRQKVTLPCLKIKGTVAAIPKTDFVNKQIPRLLGDEARKEQLWEKPNNRDETIKK